jgi:L-lactate utilization protein LutC
MNYDQLASQASVEKVVAALKSKNYEAEVVANGAAALEKIKQLIPAGASVMNGSSTTLNQIGFIDYLKSGQQGWNNLHEAILEETDKEKQALLRKQSVLSDYYLGSMHALVENGEFVIASNTGSQLPHIVYTSQNLIFVVSTKKIVPNLDEAMNRLEQDVIPQENERMMQAYGIGTTLNKILIFKGDSPMLGRKIHVILVEEDLGF